MGFNLEFGIWILLDHNYIYTWLKICIFHEEMDINVKYTEDMNTFYDLGCFRWNLNFIYKISYVKHNTQQ